MPILTFAGATGAGKSTIRKMLHEQFADIVTSLPTFTTRKRRDRDAQEHEDIVFVSDEEFVKRKDSGDFAWHANAHGFWYGTRRTDIAAALASSKLVIANLIPETTPLLRNELAVLLGDESLIDKYVLHLFLLPPSQEELIQRLELRNESPEDIQKRIATSMRWVDETKSSSIPYLFIEDTPTIEEKFEKIRKAIRDKFILL